MSAPLVFERNAVEGPPPVIGARRGMEQERRKELRLVVHQKWLEPVWIFGRQLAVGGTAVIHDVSANGLRILLNRRWARRLAAALEVALHEHTAIEIANIPRDGRRRARVVWADRHGRFGLAMTEPLSKLAAELNLCGKDGIAPEN